MSENGFLDQPVYQYFMAGIISPTAGEIMLKLLLILHKVDDQ